MADLDQIQNPLQVSKQDILNLLSNLIPKGATAKDSPTGVPANPSVQTLPMPNTPQPVTTAKPAPIQSSQTPQDEQLAAQPHAQEDRMAEAFSMMSNLAGKGPKAAVPYGVDPTTGKGVRTKADLISTFLMPLATSLGASLTGPRWNRGSRFLANLIPSGTEAGLNLATLPAKRTAQFGAAQAGQQAQNFKTAAEMMKAAAPFARQDNQVVVGTDSDGNPIYIPRAQAAGKAVGAKPTTAKEGAPSAGIDENGKPVMGTFTSGKGYVDANTQKPIKFHKINDDVKGTQTYVRNPQGQVGQVFVKKNGELDHVMFADDKGNPILLPPGYAPETVNTIRIEQRPNEDGTVDFLAVPVTETRTKNTTQGPQASTVKTPGAGAGKPRLLFSGKKPPTGAGKKEENTAEVVEGVHYLRNGLESRGVHAKDDILAFYLAGKKWADNVLDDPNKSDRDKAQTKAVLSQLYSDLKKEFPKQADNLDALEGKLKDDTAKNQSNQN